MPITEAEPSALETDRLILRAQQPEDADDLYEIARNWEVARWTARVPHPYARAMATAFLADAIRRREDGSAAGFFARRRPDGMAVGVIGAELSEDGMAATVGYMLSPAMWGQGYATEMLCCVVPHCFARWPIAAIDATVSPGHLASERVLIKAGFRYLGEGDLEMPARGGRFPVRRYALTRADWEGAGV
jgi:8-oxo-dGTP diphosphatase